MTNKNTPFGFRPIGYIYPVNTYVSSGAFVAGDSLVLAAGTVSIGLATSGSLCGVAATDSTGAGAVVLVHDHPEQQFLAMCANTSTTAVPGGIFDMSGATGAQRVNDAAVGFRTWQIVHHMATVDQPDVGANGTAIVKIAKHQMQGGGDIRHTSDPYASPAGDINIGVGNFTITALTGNYHSEGQCTIGPVALPTTTITAAGAVQIGATGAEDFSITPATLYQFGATGNEDLVIVPATSANFGPVGGELVTISLATGDMDITTGDLHVEDDVAFGPVLAPNFVWDSGAGVLTIGAAAAEDLVITAGVDAVWGPTAAPLASISLTTGAIHTEGDITAGPALAPTLDFDVGTGNFVLGAAGAEFFWATTAGDSVSVGTIAAPVFTVQISTGDTEFVTGNATVTAGDLEITAGAFNMGAAGALFSIDNAGLITVSAGMVTAPAGTNTVTAPGATDAPAAANVAFREWLEITTPTGPGFIPIYA